MLEDNNPDTAVLLSTQALNMALELCHSENITSTLKKAGQRSLSRAYSCLGVYSRINGNYPLALDYYFKALKIRELLKDDAGISSILGNIGVVYSIEKEYKQALSYYNKSLVLTKRSGDKGAIALILGNIGIAYNELGEYERALYYDFEALKIAKELNDSSALSRYLGNTGTVYKSEADTAKFQHSIIKSDSLYILALDYYSKALTLSKKLDDKTSIARHLGNIGSVFIATKKYKEAEKYVQQSLEMAAELNQQEVVKNQMQGLSEIYEETQQPAKALYYYKKYIATRDSLFNEENTKKIVRTEMNFDFDKKQAIAKIEQEKQNLIVSQEKQKQKIILSLVSCFLLLAVVFAAFIFNRWRVTKKQKQIIEKQKENIVDSITYAQLIQQSILTEESEIQKLLPDFFIFYQPKDIVSGDFYWCSEIDSKVIIAAIDCTGHGVPGAFMSMIGNTLLNQIVNEKQITTPSEILNRLNTGVFEALNHKKAGELAGDGMDIALCCIDYKKSELQYAGAKNPLYIVIEQQLQIIGADKKTIGGLSISKKEPLQIGFTNHIIPIKKGMNIYLFTDGYADQFSGGERQKFGLQQFKELIVSNSHLPMQQQKECIIKAHSSWRNNTQQIDDILVMGIKF